jgi:hypothetical protein
MANEKGIPINTAASVAGTDSDQVPLGGRQGLSAAAKAVKEGRRKYTKSKPETPAPELAKFTPEQAAKAATAKTPPTNLRIFMGASSIWREPLSHAVKFC